MSILSMRPTFTTVIPLPQNLVMMKLSEELRKPERQATCLAFDRYFELHISESELRYWSPHLSLTLDGDDHQTIVTCRFAPRQNVWTLVWILYLAFAFTLFFAIVFAYSHWILKSSTWISLLIPLSLFGIAMLYIISQTGQSWSSDQMAELRHDWVEIVENLFPSALELEQNMILRQSAGT